MKRLLLSALIFPFSLHAQVSEPAVTELRETISKIVDTQTLESGERLGWESRKAEMSALLELHQKEIMLLDEELAKAGQSAPGHDDSTGNLKSEIEALRASRRLTSEAVSRNVPRALKIAASLPAPLLTEAEDELAILHSWKATDEPREALASILALLGKAQQFNRRFNRSTQIIDGREAEVLYLGLACAFYADRKGNAGIGKPSPDGWKWEPRPALLPQIRSAFDSLDKKRPPAMVELPLIIQ